MTSLIEDLKSFLDSSPTPWHCVQQIGNRLSMRDFSPLEESSVWKMEKDKKAFLETIVPKWYEAAHDREKGYGVTNLSD